MSKTTTYYFLIFLWLFVFSGYAYADVKKGENIRIKLEGEHVENSKKRVTIKQIESIGLHEIRAYNPYEKKSDNYTGVWFEEFVKHFAKKNIKLVIFSAIDDYKIKFSKEEWTSMRILIATRMNGKYIGYAQKGPMRIIFPDFDGEKKVYQENMPKWMWMINKVNFK